MTLEPGDRRHGKLMTVDVPLPPRRSNGSYQELMAHAGPLVDRLPGDKS